ncbi:MAG: GT4 family glycosyltransferase PelF [Elusimicrobia bacterium]|nr:GT4 family glycosyltransferase PelF [Elusimicrobiota bacterium]
MTDVCLILEGTYPFVSGGVSTWIHQLLTAMSDLRFSILHISPFPNPHREYKYQVPPNVLDIQDLYLHDYDRGTARSGRAHRREAFAQLRDLHGKLLERRWEAFTELLPLLRDPARRVTHADVFQSQESWETLTWFYERFGEGVSFLDFFWTWRSIYLPLLQAAAAPIPKARLYHTVSTGYAGLVAAVAKITQDKAMLLTEHGVYTHERLLEISQATWIYSPHQDRFRIQRDLSFFKRFWFGMFETLGGIAYHNADRIMTLYEGNRTREVLAGASPEKISIVPNGIDVDLYRNIKPHPRGKGRRTVAFVGRVVPIKDVKTFIHAARIVLDKVPEAEFVILGPTDEEHEYTAECRQLAATLGLGEKLHFSGKVDMKDYYSRIDAVVLTSLSEAQPYVILEANAVGIPVVATDVGACRELLEGRLPEDRKVGPSGYLTQVAHPEETAEAVVRLLTDEEAWRRASEAGRNRTLRFYGQNDMIGQYLNLYEQNMR